MGIYNKIVREAIRDGKDCPRHLSPDLADVQYIEIDAINEAAASNKVGIRYQASQGYVIESVTKIKEYD